MNGFRKILNGAAFAVALGVVVLSAAPSSAHFGHFHHFHHGHRHSHWGSHWRFHFHHRWHSHWEHRFHWRHHGYHWAYHFGGYRHVVVEAPRACPAGTHLGYLGKFCWPNR